MNQSQVFLKELYFLIKSVTSSQPLNFTDVPKASNFNNLSATNQNTQDLSKIFSEAMKNIQNPVQHKPSIILNNW